MEAHSERAQLERPTLMARFRSRMATAAAVVAGVIGVGTGIRIMQCQSFEDIPGFDSKKEFGREVNGLSALIMGAVAQQIHANSSFEGTILKPWYPDAPVAGHTTPGEVDSLVRLTLTSAHFTASGIANEQQGRVNKSEFDWGIEQTGPHTWKVGRFGFKLDKELQIVVENGAIHGNFSRALSWDWGISGTYTPSGHVDIHVATGPLDPSFDIVGTVTGR